MTSSGRRRSSARCRSPSPRRRVARFDGDVDEHLQRHRLLVEGDLARDDPRDVEDVFDERALELRVPFDCRERVRHSPLLKHSRPEHLHPAQDGVQGRAKLVRSVGEKLVLRAVRRLGLLRARCSCSSSCTRRSSVRFRSSMSVAVMIHPEIPPRPSSSGNARPRCQRYSPSWRRRRYSASHGVPTLCVEPMRGAGRGRRDGRTGRP